MPFTQGHALVIGVGTHQFAANADVPITKADAAAVAAILGDTDACGYPSTQVNFIHDEGATKAGILTALDTLAQRAGEKDTVFLFYAGHGALGTQSNYYLVSHDARIEGKRVVEGSGVSEAELLAKLRAIKAQRMVLIFNACHSGNISPSLDLAPTLSTSNPSEEAAAALLGTGQGRIIITACGEEQFSYIGKGQLTIFTQALVDGLRGKGVANHNGFISAFNLYESIHEKVTTTVQTALHQTQEPELTVLKGKGSFAVALYKGASTLGAFDEDEALPQGLPVREVRPEKSARLFQQHIAQSGGVNFGQGNQIKIDGDVFGGDVVGPNIDARKSQGFIYEPQGPVEQQFGDRVNTGGGTYIRGNVNTGGDFVGRDKTVRGDVVHGDKIGGDKVTGDKITVGNISGNSGIAIGRGGQAHVNTTPPALALTRVEFAQLIQEARASLATVKLPENEQAEVQQNLTNLETHLAQPEPKLASIKRWLNNIKGILEEVAGVGTAATALSTLLQRAIDLAQQVFR